MKANLKLKKTISTLMVALTLTVGITSAAYAATYFGNSLNGASTEESIKI